MKYPRPQAGNPHRLTVDQHVFPRSAIARFAGADGRVDVQRLAGAAALRLKPTDPLFCARRAWDQGTETFRSHDLERDYARLADGIATGVLTALTPAMHATVSSFYSLWRHREYARLHPVPDVSVNLVAAERHVSQDAEEAAESKGVLVLRGQTLPSRWITGITMLRARDFQEQSLRGARWGIVRSDSAQFLVPDGPGELCVVPVTPSLCLCMNAPDLVVSAPQAAEINRQLGDRASHYYFAQDLARCPILRRTIPA